MAVWVQGVELPVEAWGGALLGVMQAVALRLRAAEPVAALPVEA